MYGVNPPESDFQKSTNIFATVQYMSVSFVSLRSSRVHLQNSTVILKNIAKDLCDTAYKKNCKIVILKEVCLYYVTQPLQDTMHSGMTFFGQKCSPTFDGALGVSGSGVRGNLTGMGDSF